MTTLRLLVVDDDAVDRMAVRRALARAGLPATIDEADDAMEAMSRLAGGEYDCVLLDFNIPHGDGLTLLRGIVGARLGVPVIMLSGQDDETVVDELFAAGAVDYIPKHLVTPERLRAALERAIAIRTGDDFGRSVR